MKKISTRLATLLAIALSIVCPAALADETAAESSTSSKFSVNFNERVGELKPLNGVNLWAKFSRVTLEDYQEYAEACHFSTVRLHDAPWDNEGMRLVDVHQIFGNLNADPSDPNNYYFEPTDDYIANILRGGAIPIYRLGTSIEHTERKYFAKKPQDAAKYAEICAGIVRHYNKGWANGKEWNLQYWEIWNEPNLVPQMWDDPDWNSYIDFYITVAKRLRAEFPEIKIGGPALTHPGYDMIKQFAERCKSENAPLDFVSWHFYAKTPEQLIDPPYKMREILDAAGFPNAELHINEWHYFPTEWSVVHGTNGGSEAKRELGTSPEGLHGAEACAFIELVLTRWQDGPLTMSNYYAFGLDTWGLIDIVGKLRPTYYALRSFGEQIHTAPYRVKTTDPGGNISLLGSVNAAGDVKTLLVAHYKQDDPQPITIKLEGVSSEGEVTIQQIDYDHDYVETKMSYSHGVITLVPQKSSVFFIHF